MRRLRRQLSAPLRALTLAAAVTCVAAASPQVLLDRLDAHREVADGITLFHLTDEALIDPAAPISVWMLRLDPSRVRIRAVLANDEIMGTETVAEMAARHHGAVAAINAGFFLPNGDPAGLLKLNGRLISDTTRARGALGLSESGGRMRLLFDRVTATLSVVIRRSFGRKTTVPIDGVDTTRARGKLMLFTPAYHPHTDTAKGGLEWPASGNPTQIVRGPLEGGKTPIPADGFVLSYGGRSPPPALREIKPGARVDLQAHYVPANGNVRAWADANDVVGGAGLLVRAGRYITDWAPEQFTAGFAEMRHPRTLIGVSDDDAIWLVVVDGRQPKLSSGMSLFELQSLARRLRLVDALNLDGGGSTTMWVTGAIVNSPSDAAGPRKVSDALLVFPVPH
jgi:exopolysaccharide biosynthesis protein